MSRFVFALQPLLDRFERAERDAEAALAAVASERAVALDALRALRAERDGTQRELATPGIETRAIAARLDLLSNALDRRAAMIGRAREREAAARERLTTARSERRRIAILRERALAVHRRNIAMREAAEIDESNAAGARFGRANFGQLTCRQRPEPR